MGDTKRKILFVDHDKGITGSTVSLKYLIEEFNKIDFEVYLLSPKSSEQLKYFEGKYKKAVSWEYSANLELYMQIGAKVNIYSKTKSIIRLIVKLLRGILHSHIAVKRLNPDLIYINEYVLLQFAITAKILGIPVVTHIRSPFIVGRWGIRRKLLSWMLVHFNNLVFGITKQEVEQVNCKSEIMHKLHIIPEFLSKDDFRLDYPIDELKKKYEVDVGKTVILTLGGIEPIKGTLELLSAFENLVTRYPNLLMLIVGKQNDNPLYNENCSKIIERLNNNIQVIEFSSTPGEIIAISDIVVSSSVMSHFSRPTIEAWAQGKKVVVSNTKHSTNLVSQGINGFIYELGDQKSLEKNIIDALEADDSIGKNGFDKAKQDFSAEKNIGKIIELCNRILEEN